MWLYSPRKETWGGRGSGNTISHILRRLLDFLNEKQTEKSKGHILNFLVSKYCLLFRTVRPEKCKFAVVKKYTLHTSYVSHCLCHNSYMTCKYKFTSHPCTLKFICMHTHKYIHKHQKSIHLLKILFTSLEEIKIMFTKNNKNKLQ